MESIRELFKNKNFSEDALFYLENAINEFDDLFGRFLSRDEILARINNNINSIEFVDEIKSESTCPAGQYIPEEKKVLIKKGYSIEHTKSIFFHELLHALGLDKDMICGFRNEVINNDFISFSTQYGSGWDEGFVEMMTKMRDQKYSKGETIIAYPILSEAVQTFSEMFGLDEMIEMYFKHPKDFVGFLEQRNISSDFLFDFDIIQKHEKNIYRSQNTGSRLLTSLLGTGYNISKDSNLELKAAQEDIVHTYIEQLLQGEVKSLYDLIFQIEVMSSLLDTFIGVETIEMILESISPEIISQDDFIERENRIQIHAGLEFEKYKDLGTKDKLNGVSNFFEFLLRSPIFDEPTLFKDFEGKAVEELFGGIADYTGYDFMNFLLGFKGVSQYILNSGVPFEDIRINYSDYEERRVYELFQVFLTDDGAVPIRIATLSGPDEDGFKLDEFMPASEAEKNRIEQKYNISEHGTVNEILGDGNGNYIINGISSYSEPFQFTIDAQDEKLKSRNDSILLYSISELEEEREIAKEEYCDDSLLELSIRALEDSEMIERRRNVLEKLKEEGAPDFLIKGEIGLVNLMKEQLFETKMVIKAEKQGRKIALAKHSRPVFTVDEIKDMLVRQGLISPLMEEEMPAFGESDSEEGLTEPMDDFLSQLSEMIWGAEPGDK